VANWRVFPLSVPAAALPPGAADAKVTASGIISGCVIQLWVGEMAGQLASCQK